MWLRDHAALLCNVGAAKEIEREEEVEEERRKKRWEWYWYDRMDVTDKVKALSCLTEDAPLAWCLSR
jgi:hypothetical protein